MLKQLYLTFGTTGALFVTIGLCLVALTWLLAITGTVLRSMDQWKKAGLLFLLSVLPPASIGVLIVFLINDRKLAPAVSVRKPRNVSIEIK